MNIHVIRVHCAKARRRRRKKKKKKKKGKWTTTAFRKNLYMV